ncbi:unnamed protein product [Alternaria alternata]
MQHNPVSEHEVDGFSPFGNAYNKASKKQPTPDDCGRQPLSRFDPEASLGAWDGGFPTRPAPRRAADPGPLGLSAFALTTFVLSLINVNTRSISSPKLVIGPAIFYGGVVQLLAGMWEMAAGNTFAATAFSSYAGFWLSFATILILEPALVATRTSAFLDSVGLYMAGWFVWTFLLLLCTLRSTLAFSLLFLTLALAFLMLCVGYLEHNGAGPQEDCIVAAGWFGLMAATLAWYNALAGMLVATNR